MPFFEKCDWDPDKNDQAVKDGRKPFSEMEAIFFQSDITDASIITAYADKNTGECRFMLLHHLTADMKPYKIVFAQRDEITWIISACRADRSFVRKKSSDPATAKHVLARANVRLGTATLVACAIVTHADQQQAIA
jgi:uncharacterized DUF497 family protein